MSYGPVYQTQCFSLDLCVAFILKHYGMNIHLKSGDKSEPWPWISKFSIHMEKGYGFSLFFKTYLEAI